MNIWEIHKELGFKKVESNLYKDNYFYSGVFSSGEMRNVICDYNCGLLVLKIGNHISTYNNNLKLIISTIDDGVWQAYGNKDVDLDFFVNNFHNTFGTILPNENDLNKFLEYYGIYGQYIG